MLGRRRRRKTAVILGCGPAGLFAAHALAQAGWTFDILSHKRRSELYGAQYLHIEIPGLTKYDPTPVEIQLEGTWEDSTFKVYGHRKPMITWDEYTSSRHEAWDIRAAYHAAWFAYQINIQDCPGLDATDIEMLVGSEDYGMVISSLPARKVCRGAHTFNSQQLWTIGDAPERGVFCPIPCPDNTVIVNGNLAKGLSRVSNVFGYKTAEWPEGRRPPIPNLAAVENPLGTNCNCFPEVVRVGRYGAWSRDVLSHHAYTKVRDVILYS